ncbi:hypothetical protein ZHAS_00013292 [Anopheles sinensis]|uniref:Uncharacterized protein n=1 Tax=Anopheles sinensis TaxID=74873 RepID=A0A084W548_ANOSI|nr:hypothetical protein ZHAS_00013292 [Anopheles sinensis]
MEARAHVIIRAVKGSGNSQQETVGGGRILLYNCRHTVDGATVNIAPMDRAMPGGRKRSTQSAA